jgi:hypothetical protein
MWTWVGTGTGVLVASGTPVSCGVAVGNASWNSVGDEVFAGLRVLAGFTGSGSIVGMGAVASIHPARLIKRKTVLMGKENRLRLILHPSRCKLDAWRVSASTILYHGSFFSIDA